MWYLSKRRGVVKSVDELAEVMFPLKTEHGRYDTMTVESLRYGFKKGYEAALTSSNSMQQLLVDKEIEINPVEDWVKDQQDLHEENQKLKEEIEKLSAGTIQRMWGETIEAKNRELEALEEENQKLKERVEEKINEAVALKEKLVIAKLALGRLAEDRPFYDVSVQMAKDALKEIGE
jgi:predicted  nucleic acid-binding Zn-ribbon protein